MTSPSSPTTNPVIAFAETHLPLIIKVALGIFAAIALWMFASKVVYPWFTNDTKENVGVVYAYPDSNEYRAFVYGKQVEFVEWSIDPDGEKGDFKGLTAEGDEYWAILTRSVDGASKTNVDTEYRGALFTFDPETANISEPEAKDNPFVKNKAGSGGRSGRNKKTASTTAGSST